ncbi:hypothetical protein Tco_0237035 [Tanacetum coccineum]
MQPLPTSSNVNRSSCNMIFSESLEIGAYFVVTAGSVHKGESLAKKYASQPVETTLETFSGEETVKIVWCPLLNSYDSPS